MSEETTKAKDVFSEPQSLAIAKAIQDGKETEYKALINKASDLNQAGLEDITLLHWAAYMDDKVATKLLLEAGADAALIDDAGETVAHFVTGITDPEFLQILLEEGLNPNLRDGRGEPLLFDSIMCRRMPQLKLLIKHGADLDILSDPLMQSTALHKASAINEFEGLLILLQSGANPNIKNSSGHDFLVYFNDVDESIMTDEGITERQAIKDWLSSHNNSTESK